MESKIKIKKEQIEDYAIPLAGTETNKALTGNLEISIPDDQTTRSIYANTPTNDLSISLDKENIELKVTSENQTSSFIVTPENAIITNLDPYSKGLVGNIVFDKQGDPNAFAQIGDFKLQELQDKNNGSLKTNWNNDSGINGNINIGDDNSTDGSKGFEINTSNSNQNRFIRLSPNYPLEITSTNNGNHGRIEIQSDGGVYISNYVGENDGHISLTSNEGVKINSNVKVSINNKNAITQINGQQANDAGEIILSIGANEDSFIQKSTTYTPIHNLISLTQIEYDAIEEKDATTIYFIQ